jgi:diadenosine tetraphosphate (Ap4A) HIT family hydrolase
MLLVLLPSEYIDASTKQLEKLGVAEKDLHNTALGWVTLRFASSSFALSIGGGPTVVNEANACVSLLQRSARGIPEWCVLPIGRVTKDGPQSPDAVVAAGKTLSEMTYSSENIFAKIIDGKIPCFKVYETNTSLAFLDAFPMVDGHTLIVPKKNGACNLLTMSPPDAAAWMADVQKVARAVQEATGASAVNIISNCGADAGQTVFHPHIHIIPRKTDDKLIKLPPSASAMMSKDAADPMVEKITSILRPPKPLKQPRFAKVAGVKPGGKGLNLKVKLVEDVKEVPPPEGKTLKFWEVLAGDASATVVVSLGEEEAKSLSAGKTITIQNGIVKMVKGRVRITVDKWGKIQETSDSLEGEVNKDKNISATEYELVGK